MEVERKTHTHLVLAILKSIACSWVAAGAVAEALRWYSAPEAPFLNFGVDCNGVPHVFNLV